MDKKETTKAELDELAASGLLDVFKNELNGFSKEKVDVWKKTLLDLFAYGFIGRKDSEEDMERKIFIIHKFIDLDKIDALEKVKERDGGTFALVILKFNALEEHYTFTSKIPSSDLDSLRATSRSPHKP